MWLLRLLRRQLIRSSYANQIRGKAGEQAVNSKLNPWLFGKVEHRQINDLIIVDDNNKSHQIDHIEIRENGIFCIETKNYKGWIFGDDKRDKWTQTLYNGEKHQFINPLKQNKSHIYHLSKAIDNKKYHINSLIVMARNNAKRISLPNVINLNQLKDYLNNYDDGTKLTIEEMDQIYNAFLSLKSDLTNREHINNIRKTQEELRNYICPRCGGKLIEKQGKYGPFKGCSNYPKCTFILKKNG